MNEVMFLIVALLILAVGLFVGFVYGYSKCMGYKVLVVTQFIAETQEDGQDG